MVEVAPLVDPKNVDSVVAYRTLVTRMRVMRSIGFHASKGTIRFVVVEGVSASPVVITHERRPLQLQKDRPAFVRNAKNLIGNVLATFAPDRVAYILSMDAKSQDQVAGLIMPFGALNGCALESEIPCAEFIAANFSKSFFLKNGAVWHGDRYKSADSVLGIHPPNWTNSERLAAMAAWGAL